MSGKASCLCITFDRVALLEEAVESFLRQTWPDRELIILNDVPGQRLVFDHPLVRVVSSPTRYPTLGAKRNACAALATGDVFFPWDDDDIALPNHIALSMRQLARGHFTPGMVVCLHAGAAGLATNFRPCIHGASAFTRDLFVRAGGYPEDVPQGGEDLALFDRMWACEPGIGAVETHPDDVTYYYRFGAWRHASHGQFDVPAGYVPGDAVQEIALEPLWLDDYPTMVRSLVRAARGQLDKRRKETRALVSCLLVSRGTARIHEAVAAFGRQGWAAKELVVVPTATQAASLGEELPLPGIVVVDGVRAEMSARERWQRGLAACRGRFVALWDEAAWAFPWHLATALNALTAGEHGEARDNDESASIGVYKPDRWLELRGADMGLAYDVGLGALVVERELLVRACDHLAREGVEAIDDDAMLDALEAVEPRLGAYTHAGDDHLTGYRRVVPAGAPHEDEPRRLAVRAATPDERLVEALRPYGRARVPHAFAQIPDTGEAAIATWLHLPVGPLGPVGHVGNGYRPLSSAPRRPETRVVWSVVRDPWSRALASFLGVRGDSAFRPRHPDRAEALALDFERYLERMVETRGAGRIDDPSGLALRPQIDHLADDDGRLLADVVVTHAQRDEDLAWLSAAIGGPSVAELQPAHDALLPGWRRGFEVNPRLVELVSQRFAEDIAAFGFAFDAPAPDLPVFCINRAQDTARWQRVLDLSARRGYPTQRLDAVAGDPDHRRRGHIGEGQAGCYLSHVRALRRFLDSGREWGLILEDDITLTRPYATLRHFPADAEMIYFAWLWFPDHSETRHFRPFHRLRGRRNYPWGTQCYTVRRGCARYLLGALESLPLDTSVDQRYRELLDDVVVYAAGYRVDPFCNVDDSTVTQFNQVPSSLIKPPAYGDVIARRGGA